MLNPVLLTAASAAGAPTSITEPAITLATTTTSAGAAAARTNFSSTPLTLAQKVALLRQKVKYVFVLFQENRSYDHYFGTYPGANGLFTTYPGANPNDQYAQPGTSFSSFNSVIQNVDGSFGTVSPFLNPRTITNINGATVNIYPEDMYSVDHSHGGYINDFHYDAATRSIPKNDGYPLNQEGLHFGTDASTGATVVNSSNKTPTAKPTLQTKQKGEAVIGHIDCDTIPLLWQYADQFTLFDNFHQTATGPSTPNAIAMIAGQVGDTQWVKHPSEANTSGPNLPMLQDGHPFPGSNQDTAAVQPPYGVDDGSWNHTYTGNTYPGNTSGLGAGANQNLPLTFASLPLSFMGSQIGAITAADEHKATDLVDVQHDILKIAVSNPSVNWGWYQQGYGPEPYDGTQIKSDEGSFTTAGGYPGGAPEHSSYIVHHNGPQYFGYLGDNTTELTKLHSLGQFYTDVSNQALPASGGVFYVRGGYYNNDGQTPIDPNATVQQDFAGNDDHGSYSDSQIAETLVADSVNAIANSPYWAESAIIITYDESDGFYDHQPEQFRTYGPDGAPETGGPRIPAIVVSPFAVTHAVSHVYSEHSSVIKFINELFNLTPLASLPDEAAAQAAGATNASFNSVNGAQKYLGPGDGLPSSSTVTPGVFTMGDLLEAFDNDRLTGKVAPLPASYAIIPTATTHSLPHYNGAGCSSLGITPTDYPNGYGAGKEIDPPPLDFNPRPTVSFGSPYYNTSNNTTAGSATGTGSPWGY